MTEADCAAKGMKYDVSTRKCVTGAPLGCGMCRDEECCGGAALGWKLCKSNCPPGQYVCMRVATCP